MKKHDLILILAVTIFVLAFALPVSAATTTSDGYKYEVTNGKAFITGYTGSGGALSIPATLDNCPVTRIAGYAFQDCSGITAVTIPDSILSIGAYAFNHCTGMTSLTIGKNVGTIDEAAFKNCTGLTQICWNAEEVRGFSEFDGMFDSAGVTGTGIHLIFGDSVKSIPAYAFKISSSSSAQIPKIVSVTIGINVESIGIGAFIYGQFTSVTIPDHVTSIEELAFAASNLTSITFGKGLNKIGDSAFFNSDLTAVNIPDSVTEIGELAFRFCSDLNSVILGNSIKTIGDFAFLDCNALTSVTIPKSVTELGKRAFGYYYKSEDLNRSDLTISGYTYSAGQTYANENGFIFVSLGGRFSDVVAGKWYETAIDDLVVKGIFSGYDNGDGTYSFKPENRITRAEFAAILARASKDDLAQYTNTSFTDVSGWASNSVEWAYQHHIVYGTGDGKYSPNECITRQDMAVMIKRYADNRGITLLPTATAINFADQSSISAYAADAVNAMQRAGIINGSNSNGKTYFNAQDNATRAEAAVMMSKFLR